MSAARDDLSKELYALSGWWDDEENGRAPGQPYYTLGYLLRKLPEYVTVNGNKGVLMIEKRRASYMYWDYDFFEVAEAEADNPEDATARLAIQLIKQGVIRPEASR